MSYDRETRAKRRHKTQAVIKRQAKIARAAGVSVEANHKLAKMHALDCGNPKCLVCHSDKVFRKPTLQEKRFDQREYI